MRPSCRYVTNLITLRYEVIGVLRKVATLRDVVCNLNIEGPQSVIVKFVSFFCSIIWVIKLNRNKFNRSYMAKDM